MVQRRRPELRGRVEVPDVGVRAGQQRHELSERLASGGSFFPRSFEGRLQVVDRFEIRTPVQRLAAREGEILRRLLPQLASVRAREVEGEFIGVIYCPGPVVLLHRLGDDAMENSSALKPEFVVQGLTHERVPEAVDDVPVVGVLGEHTVRAQFLECRQRLVRFQSADRSQQCVACATPDDGHEIGQRSTGFG